MCLIVEAESEQLNPDTAMKTVSWRSSSCNKNTNIRTKLMHTQVMEEDVVILTDLAVVHVKISKGIYEHIPPSMPEWQLMGHKIK